MTDALYKFQSLAVDRMAKGEAVYIGFDPGLGKSRAALEAAQRRGVTRMLIACPASGRYVWENEVRKWWKAGHRLTIVFSPRDLKAGPGLFLVTYGQISQRESPFVTAICRGEPFDMSVIDEAVAVKNPGSNRTRAILGKMLPKLGYVIPMSGTPAPNHAGEMYPILRALYPSAIRSASMNSAAPMSQFQFEDMFCRVVNKRFGNGPSVRVIEGSRNIPELRKRMENFLIRVRKETVLKDLPPLRWDVVPLTSDGIPVLPATDALDAIPDDELLKRLSRAVPGDSYARLRSTLGLAKVAAAVEYIDDFMTNLPDGRKLLVFAHHREVIQKLVEGLGDWSPVVVTGSTTPALRTQYVDMFLNNDRCRIFIANIQAAGTGLTLVGPKCKCADVVFVEATYSPADNLQAACRVHRIGQHDAVVARFLTVHGTIDDRIHQILARKARDFKELFNKE